MALLRLNQVAPKDSLRSAILMHIQIIGYDYPSTIETQNLIQCQAVSAVTCITLLTGNKPAVTQSDNADAAAQNGSHRASQRMRQVTLADRP